MYQTKSPVNYSEIIELSNQHQLNTQDYFRDYQQKMENLQKSKLSEDKDSKFFNYMKRLVEAPQIREVERFNGSQVLKEFILDKGSLVSHKKKVQNELKLNLQQLEEPKIQVNSRDIDFSGYYKLSHDERVKLLYQKEALGVKQYDPQIQEGFLTKNFVAKVQKRQRRDKSENNGGAQPLSQASINLLRKLDKNYSRSIPKNGNLTTNQSKTATRKPTQGNANPQIQTILSYYADQDFNLHQTLQPNERSLLVAPEQPVLKARIPALFGNPNTRNLSSNETVFQMRAQSLNQSALIPNKGLLDSINESQNNKTFVHTKQMDSQQVLVDYKKRELVSLKKANYYNNIVYDNNVQNINKVKNHWNKRILDPKIDKIYQHTTVLPHNENELEESIKKVIYPSEKALNIKNNSGIRQDLKTSVMKSISKDRDEDYEERSPSKLSQVLRMSNDLGIIASKSNHLQPEDDYHNKSMNKKQIIHSAQKSIRSLQMLDKLDSAHNVVFIEDGECIETCKSIKINLNIIKQKYFIEPPKFISQLPESYIKIQSQFSKRAFKELLEICSSELTQKEKVFQSMYAFDGELIESLDQISEDIKLIIVSESRKVFKGLQNLKVTLGNQELRLENSKDVKKQIISQNKEWNDQNYLEWVGRAVDKFGIENMQIAISNHANNQYLLNNSDYRQNFQKKLGYQHSISPTFQGGGFKNSNEFLLPEIQKGTIQDQLHRLRSDMMVNKQGQYELPRSARWEDEFIQAIDKFKQVNQPKEKLHLSVVKPSGMSGNDSSKNDQPPYKNANNINSVNRNNNDYSSLQTQAIKKEVKVKSHMKSIQQQKASGRNAGGGTNNKNTLSYEECKKLSDDYLLPCKVIYELHSEYNSLLDMAQEKSKAHQHDGQNEDQEQDYDEGVPLTMFRDSCTILKEKYPLIADRILEALNISTTVRNAKINWQSFLLFYSLTKYFTATQQMFTAFWINFFNPKHLQTIPKDDFIDIAEKLARGSFTENKTLVSIKYSNGFYKMLLEKNCVKEENGNIIIEKMEKKLLKNEIDIEYLNQTLKPDCEYILDDDEIYFEK